MEDRKNNSAVPATTTDSVNEAATPTDQKSENTPTGEVGDNRVADVFSDAHFVPISLPTPRQRREKEDAAAAAKEKAAREQREAAARDEIGVAEDLRRLRQERHAAYVAVKGNIQLRQAEKHRTPRETEQQRFAKAVEKLKERDAKEKEAETRFKEIRDGLVDEAVDLHRRQLQARKEELLKKDKERKEQQVEAERLEREQAEATKKRQAELREKYTQERIQKQKEIERKRIEQWKAEEKAGKEEARRMRETSEHIADALEEYHREREQLPQPPRRFFLNVRDEAFALRPTNAAQVQPSQRPARTIPANESLFAPAIQTTRSNSSAETFLLGRARQQQQSCASRLRQLMWPAQPSIQPTNTATTPQPRSETRREVQDGRPNAMNEGHLGGIALSRRPPRRPQGAPTVASFIAARPPTTTTPAEAPRGNTASTTTTPTRVARPLSELEERRLVDGTWGPRNLEQYERMRELQGRPVDHRLPEPKRVQHWVDYMLLHNFWTAKSTQQEERLALLQAARRRRNRE